MANYLVQTKLFIPPLRPSLVARARLMQKLNLGLGRKLTLISAPAGFGKSTLVSEWIAGCRHPVAWLSLDAGDGEPARFLAYCVAALQTIMPTVGDSTLALLDAPQPPPLESILALLLNEITAIPNDFVLVLDDYHLIASAPIDQALTFLLDHLPPQMHLIITTREDPDLPLPRYRVRNQLTEVRANDLRFTATEVAAFLNQAMDLPLSIDQITALETRTEGWVAGLQLATLALQGALSPEQTVETIEKTVANFIRAFTGSHHFVLAYLVQEVLQQQSDAVRTFLLYTSILDTLSGPLCDAVTKSDGPKLALRNDDVNKDAHQDGKRMLDALERGNLFVIPLDQERQWFRYHHLFADALRARLIAEQPEQLPRLHQRASAWYEEHGLRADAIRHAIAAEDFEQAANLIELLWRELDRNYQNATSLGWLRALPDELLRIRPILSAGYAWALLAAGELEAAEQRLRDAERWLNPTARAREAVEGEMVVVDQAEFVKLPATIASARTYLAQALGDLPAVVKYANRTLALLPADELFERTIPTALLGLAHWANGDLEAAYHAFADVMHPMQIAGKAPHAVGAGFVAALIKTTQGDLRQARQICQRSLQLATELGEPMPRGVAELYVIQAELHREAGDLDAASHYLSAHTGVGVRAILPGNEYLWYLAMARLKESHGDMESAHLMLNEAERLQKPDPIPDVRPVAAHRARLWAMQGRLTEAFHWVRQRGLSVDGAPEYMHEFEQIVFARILITHYQRDHEEAVILDAVRLLERLRPPAEASGRIRSVIEISLLQALAHQAQDDMDAALTALQRALRFAEPEGFIQIFVDEGVSIRNLLTRLSTNSWHPESLDSQEGSRMQAYVHQLLAAWENRPQKPNESRLAGVPLPPDPSPPAQSPAEPLTALQTDPLSARELEVLQLIAQGLSNREISQRLFLALSTVKGHNRIIFDKLQVQSRTEAIARGRQLGLV
ncbi:MAG: helix-turn-helix transcriptional regulator [Caldilineaceae bacterium]|nr:helix-turn-helix transcriptional regulator [Caldilineaceae bacterium]